MHVALNSTLIRALALMLIPLAALAGRPLSTEDAAVLEDKACQLEMWIDRSRVASDGWTAPACTIAGIELQAGGARTHAGESQGLTQAYAQAKAAFVSVEEHPWGVGLVLGVVRSPKRETHNGWDDPYVTVPVSFKAGPEGGLLHLNAGWLRDTAERRNLTTWGVAYEVPLASTPIVLLGEAFGENARNPSGRLGVRWTGVAKNLDLDLTVVARSGGTREERFVSLGLYYKLDPFLP